jgi:nitroimidazol reductase NimA-like FMN-containing flavoprotein (pyridoxamine 5'-phosphate oxidase superfamily)
MDETTRRQIISIIDDVDDMTIATVREDGYPQATTVSYVNDGLSIYFGTSGDSQKAKNIARNDRVSLTINRAYDSWDDIEGISMAGRARLVTDPAEQQKVGELLFRKFPQIAQYALPEEVGSFAFFCIDPTVVSLLDYSKDFGHTELVVVGND